MLQSRKERMTMAPNISPRKGCPERFTACSDKCPKDVRGEYGYKAWMAELRKRQAAEKEYKLRRREEYLRSEQCEAEKQNYAKSRTGKIGGITYGRK